MTLKQIWEEKGMTPTEVAAAAKITTVTLYAMARKERVSRRTLVSVCHVLRISRQEYEKLEKY